MRIALVCLTAGAIAVVVAETQRQPNRRIPPRVILSSPSSPQVRSSEMSREARLTAFAKAGVKLSIASLREPIILTPQTPVVPNNGYLGVSGGNLNPYGDTLDFVPAQGYADVRFRGVRQNQAVLVTLKYDSSEDARLQFHPGAEKDGFTSDTTVSVPRGAKNAKVSVVLKYPLAGWHYLSIGAISGTGVPSSPGRITIRRVEITAVDVPM